MKYYISIVTLLLLMCARGQTPHKEKPPLRPSTATLTLIPPEFKTTTLKDHVAESISQLKQNDASFLLYLVQTHEADADELLSFLQPYAQDPDGRVKNGIVEAASAAHSLKAFKLLSGFVGDTTAGDGAMASLYFKYTRQELLEWGGQPFKSALLRGVIADREATYGNMLLSLYKGNASIRAFLERRLKSYKLAPDKASTQHPNGAPDSADAIERQSISERILTIDLALTELGEPGALARITARFKKRNVEELITLVQYLKFVDNKTILLQSVELLKDKRSMWQTSVAGPPGVVPHAVRVCDEAYKALQDRAGVAVPGSSSPTHFSDKQLSEAYTKFKTLFGTT